MVGKIQTELEIFIRCAFLLFDDTKTMIFFPPNKIMKII